MIFIAIVFEAVGNHHAAFAEKPTIGTTKQVDLGADVTVKLVFVPAGEFKMGSTPTERKWATGIRAIL